MSAGQPAATHGTHGWRSARMSDDTLQNDTLRIMQFAHVKYRNN